MKMNKMLKVKKLLGIITYRSAKSLDFKRGSMTKEARINSLLYGFKAEQIRVNASYVKRYLFFRDIKTRNKSYESLILDTEDISTDDLFEMIEDLINE